MIKQYGDWQQAKQFLDNLNEPRITDSGDDWRHIKVSLPDILGYQCQYYKNTPKESDKITSYAVVVNPNTNSCYIKNFGITEEEASKIFNN